MARVMITDGNNVHPADYHAEVTAEKIVVVGETASAEQVTASRSLRKAIEAVLTAHHCTVAADEQAKLKEHGFDRLSHPLDAAPHVTDTIVQEIVACAKGTILEAHFGRADVQAVIAEILHHETRSQMNVHRVAPPATPPASPPLA
jgi:cation diffusion facilitator CzcD-associated flavoprotein CzcO